jgi:hypothetical protein
MRQAEETKKERNKKKLNKNNNKLSLRFNYTFNCELYIFIVKNYLQATCSARLI